MDKLQRGCGTSLASARRGRGAWIPEGSIEVAHREQGAISSQGRVITVNKLETAPGRAPGYDNCKQEDAARKPS